MIKPTIGRVVWFYRAGLQQKSEGIQPMSAQIAYVHTDSMINIGYFDHNGMACAYTSVPLVQDGEAPPEGSFPFCEWMPYQIGQAKKETPAS